MVWGGVAAPSQTATDRRQDVDTQQITPHMDNPSSNKGERLPAKLETVEEAWDYIQAIDMSLFRTKLHEPRWGRPIPQHVLDHAIQDYQRFLFLMRKYPGEPLSPTLDIDLIWHEHILDSMPYFQDTARIFGHYVHHEPGRTPGERTPDLEKSFLRTCELYRKEFGEELQTFFGNLSPAEGDDRLNPQEP